MRKLVLITLLLASSPTYGEPFAELAGGLVAPVSNDDWTSAVEPSFKLAARLGSDAPGLGFMASVDWTPLAADSSLISFNRFRILGHLQFRSRIAKNATLSGRFGAGVDILHESAEITIPLIGTVKGSDSDLGIAFEAALGAWFDVGSLQLGGEVALPIGYHSSAGNPNNPADPNDAKFDYTSVDIDVMLGVRFGL